MKPCLRTGSSTVAYTIVEDPTGPFIVLKPGTYKFTGIPGAVDNKEYPVGGQMNLWLPHHDDWTVTVVE